MLDYIDYLGRVMKLILIFCLEDIFELINSLLISSHVTKNFLCLAKRSPITGKTVI